MKRKLKLIIIWLLGALLVGYLTLFVAVKIFFPAHHLKDTITTHLSAAIGEKVEIGQAGVTIFPQFCLNAEDVTIANAENFSKSPLLRVQNLLLNVKLLPLLSKHIEVESIVIKNPEILIEKSSKGVFNFASTSVEDGNVHTDTGKTETAPVSLVVRSAKIVGGAVKYVDHQKNTTLTIDGIDEDLYLSFDNDASEIDVNGKTGIKSVDFHYINHKSNAVKLPSAILKHRLKINTQSKRMGIDLLQLSLLSAQFRSTGSVDQYDSVPQIDLNLRSNDMELADLLKVLGAENYPELRKVKGTGKIDLQAHVQGEFSEKKSPQVRGQMAFTNLELNSPTLPEKITDLSGKARFSNDRVTIENMTALLGKTPIEFSGATLDMRNSHFGLNMKTDLELSEVKKFVALPQGMNMSGRMQVAMQANGFLTQPRKAIYNGKIKLSRGSFKSSELSVPLTDIAGEFNFADENVQIANLTLRAGKSSATMTGKIFDPVNHRTGVLNFTSPMVDLDELFPKSDSQTPKKLSATQENIQLPFDKLDSDVHIEKLITNDVALTDVRAKVSIRNNVLTIKNVRLNLYSGKLTGNVRGDFNDPSGLGYDVQLKCSGVDVNDFATVSVPMKDTFFGKMDLEMNASGKGTSIDAIKKNIVADGRAVVSDGKIANLHLLNSLANFLNLPSFENVNFKTLNNSFKLKNEKLSFDEMKLNVLGNDISLGGFMGLDGALNFSMSMLLSEQLTQRFRQKAVNVPDFLLVDSKRLPLDLLITGSKDNPVIRWNTEKAFRRTAQVHVEKGLQSLFSSLQKKAEKKTSTENDTTVTAAAVSPKDSVQARSTAKADPVENILHSLGSLFGKKKKKKQ